MLATIALVGWSRLFDPFAGDQALFLIAAEALHRGGVLYRDFWDIKQPAVFAFFLVGGRGFGFDQVGEHLADLTWQIVFAAALYAGLRPCFPRRPAVTAFAPLAIVVAYYAGSSSWHLLQVEELVGLPLFCSAWLLVRALHRRSATLALCAGLCAGIVLLFKFIFVAIVLALVAAIVTPPARGGRPGADASVVRAWLGGVLLPIAAVAAYALANGTGAETARTTFVIPFEVLLSLPAHAPASRLADSSLRFLLYYRGLLLLALVGALVADAENDAETTWRRIAFAWIAAAASVIAMQISSWWQYHFLLFVPPLGILASFGLDVIVRNLRAGRIASISALALAGIVAFVAVPLPQGAIGTVLAVLHDRPYASGAALENYRIAASHEYAEAYRDARFARRGDGVRSMYVFGDPLIYVDSGTIQPIAINSWAIQLFTPGLWKRTDEEFHAKMPDDVFVFDRFVGHLRTGDRGAVLQTIVRRYAVAERTEDGTWYRRRDATACCAAIAPVPRSRVTASRTRRTGAGRGRGSRRSAPRARSRGRSRES